MHNLPYYAYSPYRVIISAAYTIDFFCCFCQFLLLKLFFFCGHLFWFFSCSVISTYFPFVSISFIFVAFFISFFSVMSWSSIDDITGADLPYIYCYPHFFMRISITAYAHRHFYEDVPRQLCTSSLFIKLCFANYAHPRLLWTCVSSIMHILVFYENVPRQLGTSSLIMNTCLINYAHPRFL